MESAQNLVGRVLVSQQVIARLSAARDAIEKEHRDKIWAIGRGFTDRIQALEHEKNVVIQELTREKESAYQGKANEIIELREVQIKVKRMLDFLHLDSTRDLSIPDDAPQMRNGYRGTRHLESLGYIVDERFLKVKLFIAENDKSVNKYSLCALGQTIFYEALLKLPRNYGCPFYTKGHYEVEYVFKDWPSVTEITAWLAKPVNREKVMLQVKGEYDTVEREYTDTVKHYKASDFKPLMWAVCEKCGYFYTDLDDRTRADYERRQDSPECPHCSRFDEATQKTIPQPMTLLERRVFDSKEA